MDFWRNINILNPNQFAYMEGRSTLSELLSCYDDWAKSRNNRKPTDIAFLDFSKAFDSVPHERLLFNVERHGIDGSALQWFRNFLTGWCNASSCVVLARPALQFYQEYPKEQPWSRLIHFIRKWHLVREISDIARDTSILQSDLFHLRNWPEVWQLNFTANKCEIMLHIIAINLSHITPSSRVENV